MEIIKDLPEIFDEFEDMKKQSFWKVKEYKEKQIPIIGAYCSFFPREIAVAREQFLWGYVLQRMKQ